MKAPENNENEERFEHLNKPEHETTERGENEEETTADDTEEYGAEEGEYKEGNKEESKFNFKGFSVEDVAEKVMAYIKGNNEKVDKEALLKYAAVAVLALYGLRKTGFLGSILISGAVALIAKHFILADDKETAPTEEETEVA